jgi:hypothetical protein
LFTNIGKNWRTLLTLAICVAGGTSVLIALALEWQAAPEWLSPRHFFTPDGFLFLGGWQSALLGLCLLALVPLSWINHGRVLLRATAFMLLLAVALTMLRWQSALAYAMLSFLVILAGGPSWNASCLRCRSVTGH